MKYKVITPYVDKYTLEEHRTDEVVDVTAERAKELDGYIKKIGFKKKKAEDE